jgi:hypothetical protein
MAPATPRLRILAGSWLLSLTQERCTHRSSILVSNLDYGRWQTSAILQCLSTTILCSPKLTYLTVGGNAVSAYLTWRLQATNACDVTLVWKNNFESVAQYGLTFK